MSTIRMFVYGTLKRGQRQDLSRYKPSPRQLGEGWVAGRLYDLGHCPALVLDASAGPVWGEVWEVDEVLFHALDRYEAECGDFHLRRAQVHFRGGIEDLAVYEIGALERLPAAQLSAGRWPVSHRS
jgi:gamma-glutamylcyclotransferase (GGCT)/AIG2-like uncharacterized protein YtfP